MSKKYRIFYIHIKVFGSFSKIISRSGGTWLFLSQMSPQFFFFFYWNGYTYGEYINSRLQVTFSCFFAYLVIFHCVLSIKDGMFRGIGLHYLPIKSVEFYSIKQFNYQWILFILPVGLMFCSQSKGHPYFRACFLFRRHGLPRSELNACSASKVSLL